MTIMMILLESSYVGRYPMAPATPLHLGMATQFQHCAYTIIAPSSRHDNPSLGLVHSQRGLLYRKLNPSSP
jgi:hypothetical protein